MIGRALRPLVQPLNRQGLATMRPPNGDKGGRRLSLVTTEGIHRGPAAGGASRGGHCLSRRLQ